MIVLEVSESVEVNSTNYLHVVINVVIYMYDVVGVIAVTV